MDLKMIVSDLDSTLLRDDKTISKKNKEYIRLAIKKGISFVIATGRVLISAKNYRDQLDESISVIASNGAVVTDSHDEIIYSKTLDHEILKRIDKIAKDYQVPLYLSGLDHIYARKSNINDKYIDNNFNNTLDKNIRIRQFEDFDFIIESDRDIYKAIFISHEEGGFIEIKKELEKLDNIEITSSGSHNLEILAKGVDKSTALAKLLDYKDISKNQVMAIGDNLNDKAMLEYVGLGISVENGHLDVLNIADHITVSNEEDALAEVIRKYIL